MRHSMNRCRPLRCCFVITSMPVGGAEVLLVNLMRRMDPAVISPEVICLKEPGPLGKTLSNEFPVHSHLIGGKYDLTVLPRLARLLRRRRADAVITVGAGDKMFWGRLAAKLAGVPVIASALHSTGWPDGVGRLNRWLTPLTDAFIAVAQSHGEFLQSFERFPAEKVSVIRNGVDCQRFQPDLSARAELRASLGLAEETPLIGLVAALRPEKNHSMLVQAAASLRDAFPDLHTLIIGEGPERETIERLNQELKVHDRVHLLGNRNDTPRLLAGLDLFTLCSLNEASPVSILEALACGTPVVATDVGSISETVIENQTGSLVPSGDLDRFCEAISTLLRHPAERQAMGRAGRELVLQTGSLDSMVDGYQELLQQTYARKTSVRRGPVRMPGGGMEPVTIRPPRTAGMQTTTTR